MVKLLKFLFLMIIVCFLCWESRCKETKDPIRFWSQYSGEINTTALFLPPGEDLETNQSMTAIRIMYNVTFKANLCYQCQRVNTNDGTNKTCCPILEMFTLGRFYRNPNKTCEDRSDDLSSVPWQLSWSIVLDRINEDSGCVLNSDNNVNCQGERTFSVGVPRNFGFTFSACKSRVGIRLIYSIAFEAITENGTRCERMTEAVKRLCGEVGYRQIMMPGLLGLPTQTQVFESLGSMVFFTTKILKLCHQRSLAVVCRVLFPECLNGRRVLPCREQCETVVNACWQLTSLKDIWFSCDQFAYKDSVVPCYYEPVRCPLLVKPLTGSVNITGLGTQSTATYACSEGFSTESNTKRHCTASGIWNGTAPLCTKMKKSYNIQVKTVLWSVIPICVLIVAGAFTALSVKRYVNKRNIRREAPEGDHKYDMFISYCSSDAEFVEGEFLSRLEEEHDPPVRLCIHARDFMPGDYIVSNIIDAIENSTICLIILSKHYVKSGWCKEEFALCYSHMISSNLPSYTVQVALLEDVPLRDMPAIMRGFCQSVTYIKYGHPNFWGKIFKIIDKIVTSKVQESAL